MKTIYGIGSPRLLRDLQLCSALLDWINASLSRRAFAAHIMLHRVKSWSVLRVWGVKGAQRQGNKRATVVPARKIAVVMHRMWMEGTTFRFSAAGRARMCQLFACAMHRKQPSSYGHCPSESRHFLHSSCIHAYVS